MRPRRTALLLGLLAFPLALLLLGAAWQQRADDPLATPPGAEGCR